MSNHNQMGPGFTHFDDTDSGECPCRGVVQGTYTVKVVRKPLRAYVRGLKEEYASTPKWKFLQRLWLRRRIKVWELISNNERNGKL